MALFVLLIDDNPHDARRVEALFDQIEREGLLLSDPEAGDIDSEYDGDFEFAREGSLNEGLERLSEVDPDVLLLDLQLPDSDGLDTVERTLSEVQDVPIVVLTGTPESRLGIEAIAMGAQDYLVKDDIGPELLARTVKYAVERKKTRRKIRRQSERLTLMNRLMRHDINNDISLIVGRAEELTEHVEPEGQKLLEDVIQSGNHALQLTRSIGETLDSVTREDPVEFATIDLNRVLTAEVEKAKTLYRGSDIALGDVPNVEVRADELLGSVFGNLISNAVYFNDKEQATVRIDATTDDESVIVQVADNGPGIPAHQRGEIFEAGVQDSQSMGLGVGLAIVERLVTQYGGSITVEENDPEGSVFHVHLERA